ncbi:MAG: hypothetical protein IPL32_03815 [Chloracidobacterium sp.]|nr:hypothetical protein [Chloracidobacterium sp.]
MKRCSYYCRTATGIDPGDLQMTWDPTRALADIKASFLAVAVYYLYAPAFETDEFGA